MQFAQEGLQRAGELDALPEAGDPRLAGERVQGAIHLAEQLRTLLQPAQVGGVGLALHHGLQPLADFREQLR